MEWVLGVMGLVLTVIVPSIGWLLLSINKSAQDNATQQRDIDSLLKERETNSESFKKLFNDFSDLNTRKKVLKAEVVFLQSNVKAIDNGLSKSITELNACISDLRRDLHKHEQETTNIIKKELEETKTTIMDRLELMMLKQDKRQ